MDTPENLRLHQNPKAIYAVCPSFKAARAASAATRRAIQILPHDEYIFVGMERRFVNLTHPVTAESTRRLVEWLLSNDHETLFLDLPQGTEAALSSLAEIRGEPPSPYLKPYHPLVQALPALSSMGVELHCYISPAYSKVHEDLVYELVALGLKARLGVVRVEEWRRLIERHIVASINHAREHLDYILSRAKTVNVCVNLPAEVKERLVRLGENVEEVVIERSCRPTEPLWEMVRASLLYGKPFDEEQARKVISEYAEFLGLVVEKGFEEAYALWKSRQGCG